MVFRVILVSVVTTIEITVDTVVFSYHRISTTIAISIVLLAVFLNPVSWKLPITIKTVHFLLVAVSCYD